MPHDFTTGEVLTAALVESWLQPVMVAKTADETVNNSTTLQSDNHLFVPVEANALYAMTLWLNLSSGTVPDFKFDFTGPASFAYRGICHSTSGTSMDMREVDGGVTNPPAFGQGRLLVVGHVDTAGTAGTMTLRWAQNTAEASDTIVQNNSYLMLQRVD